MQKGQQLKRNVGTSLLGGHIVVGGMNACRQQTKHDMEAHWLEVCVCVVCVLGGLEKGGMISAVSQGRWT